jgi:hypothetical protein
VGTSEWHFRLSTALVDLHNNASTQFPKSDKVGSSILNSTALGRMPKEKKFNDGDAM